MQREWTHFDILGNLLFLLTLLINVTVNYGTKLSAIILIHLINVYHPSELGDRESAIINLFFLRLIQTDLDFKNMPLLILIDILRTFIIRHV